MTKKQLDLLGNPIPSQKFLNIETKLKLKELFYYPDLNLNPNSSFGEIAKLIYTIKDSNIKNLLFNRLLYLLCIVDFKAWKQYERFLELLYVTKGTNILKLKFDELLLVMNQLELDNNEKIELFSELLKTIENTNLVKIKFFTLLEFVNQIPENTKKMEFFSILVYLIEGTHFLRNHFIKILNYFSKVNLNINMKESLFSKLFKALKSVQITKLNENLYYKIVYYTTEQSANDFIVENFNELLNAIKTMGSYVQTPAFLFLLDAVEEHGLIQDKFNDFLEWIASVGMYSKPPAITKLINAINRTPLITAKFDDIIKIIEPMRSSSDKANLYLHLFEIFRENKLPDEKFTLLLKSFEGNSEIFRQIVGGITVKRNNLITENFPLLMKIVDEFSNYYDSKWEILFYLVERVKETNVYDKCSFLIESQIISFLEYLDTLSDDKLLKYRDSSLLEKVREILRTKKIKKVTKQFSYIKSKLNKLIKNERKERRKSEKISKKNVKRQINKIIKKVNISKKKLEQSIKQKCEEFKIPREAALFIIAYELLTPKRRRSIDKKISPYIIDQITLKEILEEKYLNSNRYRHILINLTQADIKMIANELNSHYRWHEKSLLPFLLEDKIDLLTLLLLIHLFKSEIRDGNIFDHSLDLVHFRQPWNDEEQRLMNSFEITYKLLEFCSLEPCNYFKEVEDQQEFAKKTDELYMDLKNFYNNISKENLELLKEQINENIKNESIQTIYVILKLDLLNIFATKELDVLMLDPESNWLQMLLQVFLNTILVSQHSSQWLKIIKSNYKYADLWRHGDIQFKTETLLSNWSEKNLVKRKLIIEIIFKILDSKSLYSPLKQLGMKKFVKKLDSTESTFIPHSYIEFFEKKIKKLNKIMKKQQKNKSVYGAITNVSI